MRTFKDWVIASRPWSFPASLIPVVAISAYFFYANHGQGNWINALLSLPMLVFLQAAGNLIGDYFDHKKLVDLPGSLNGVRHIQSGKFTPKEILYYGFTMLALAMVLGVIILCRSSWQYAWLGIVGVLMTSFYPWLKYHALGDLDVLCGYALLPALGISCVVTGQYHWEAMLYSLPFGLLTVSILHANNTRDIMNDSRAGIYTMCIGLGGRVSQWLYLIEIVAAYTLLVTFVACGWLPLISLLPLVTLPMAYSRVRTMMQAEPLAEMPIASLDQQTAQLQLTFGLLFAVSFVIAYFL